VLAELPAGEIGVNNMVLLNYKAFPEWRDLEHSQRGHPDRAGSLLYELGILMTILSISDLIAGGLDALIRSTVYMGMQQNWAGVALNTFRTLRYDVSWMHALASSRINCLIEFSSRGRDG
jgi:hypothetical protein